MLSLRGIRIVPDEVISWASTASSRKTVTFTDVLAAFRGPKLRITYGLGGGARRGTGKVEPMKPPSKSGATSHNPGKGCAAPPVLPAGTGSAKTLVEKELARMGFDEALVKFAVGAGDGTLESAVSILYLAGARSPTTTLRTSPFQEYVRRARAEFNYDVEVVDLGVLAGPAPRTNACQWLSAIAAASRVLPAGEQVPDVELWRAIADDIATVRATPAHELRRGARATPRLDAVGTAADALRGHVCDDMRRAEGQARWLPSFALTAGRQNAPGGGGVGAREYHAHVHSMRTTAFADHNTLVEIAERLRVKIIVLPEHEALGTIIIDHVEQSDDRMLLLGNDNMHYVWLARSDQLPGQ